MRLRPLMIVLGIASGHFAAALALGVLAFITQGSLTSPTPATGAHGLVSFAAAVLEFPLVWLVRVQSPERLTYFSFAAACNSILWGVVAWWVGRTVARNRAARVAIGSDTR